MNLKKHFKRDSKNKSICFVSNLALVQIVSLCYLVFGDGHVC